MSRAKICGNISVPFDAKYGSKMCCYDKQGCVISYNMFVSEET